MPDPPQIESPDSEGAKTRNGKSARRFIVQYLLLTVLIVSCFVLSVKQSTPRNRPSSTEVEKPIPPGGLAQNDTHGTVPGNPEAAIASLKRIWVWKRIYDRRHPDSPCNDVSKLLVDIVWKPREYNVTAGRGAVKEAFSVFTNPDSKYADSPSTRKSPATTFIYQFRRERPDGTKLGGPKRPGTQDVIAFTDIYVHKNLRTFPDGRRVDNPVGFYLVLWEDGRVEKMPYNKIVWTPYMGAYRAAFPGEAGIPKTAVPYGDITKVVMAGVTGKSHK